MTELPPKTHNRDPLDILLDTLLDMKDELDGWQDGTTVESPEQMEAVDVLIKEVKLLEKTATADKETEYRPHKIASDLVVTKWSGILKELDGHKKGLAAVQNDFKVKLRKEQEEREEAARALAREAERIATEAARKADMRNVEERRAADEANLTAKKLKKDAQQISKQKVTGLRTVKTVTITDREAFVTWLRANRRQEMLDFLQEQAAKAAREVGHVNGITITTSQIAY